MAWIGKQKFFNRYLPFALSVILLVSAALVYQFFIQSPQVAEAAPALVSGQSASCSTGTGSCTIPYPSPNVAHNFLVAECEGIGGSTCSLTDTAGNSWILANQGDNSLNSHISILYVNDAKGGANTVTCNISSSGGWQTCAVAEFSGISNVSPLDQTASGANSSTVNWNVTAGGATAQASELIIGAGGTASTDNAGAVFSAGSNFFIATNDNPCSQSCAYPSQGTSYLEYRAISSQGTYSAPAVNAQAESGMSLIATFKGTAAKTGNFVQQGGKFIQRGGKVVVGGV